MKRADFLQRTRQILLKRREALRRSLAGELALRGCSETAADECDEAQDAESDVVFSRIADSETRELAAIDNALGRLRNGEYGVCEECGGRILLARLQALPYATVCIKCQRESETRDGGCDGRGHWSRVADSRGDDDNLTLAAAELMLS